MWGQWRVGDVEWGGHRRRFIFAYLQSEEAVETCIQILRLKILGSILVLLQMSCLTLDKSLYFSKFWILGFPVIQMNTEV